MPSINLLVLAAFVCTVSGARPTKEEAACFAKEKFYHEPTKKCYDILTEGPCPKGEWFVLRKPLKSDAEVIVKAVCERVN